MILVKGGRLMDPASNTDQFFDLIIAQDKILEIGHFQDNGEYEAVVDASGCIVAPGLIDVHVHFREPGFTYKEDIMSGAAAAAKGGFTSVVCMANTKPPVDNPETLSYVIGQGRKTAINVFTCANISLGMKGQTLTDMAGLQAAGAIGFTDDGMPLMNGRFVQEAMLIAKQLNVPLSFHEEDPTFITNNGIHAGTSANTLKLIGSPAIAEDSMVARDCMIALHTGASISIQHISSRHSVEMVRHFKALGARVWAEVTPHHFTLTDEALLKHGSLAKMNPPLRTEEDRLALIDGLKDGTIDLIATDHAPHSTEEKAAPLEKCPSGIIGLETALSLGLTELVAKGHLSILQLIEKMSFNPAQFYHLDRGTIAPGKAADLVIFNAEESHIVNDFVSKSSNSPFVGQRLQGTIKYTICNGRIIYQN